MERLAECDVIVSDDELAALALAADPEAPVDPDAVPLRSAELAGGLLPEWYMPAATSRVRGPVRRGLVGAVVVALVVINCAGLCVTYGFPEIAW